MGRTLAQKIIARASGGKDVAIGDVVICEPDVFETIDLVMPHYIKTLKDEGFPGFRFPDRIVVFADHEVPSQTPQAAMAKKKLRGQLDEMGITHFYS